MAKRETREQLIEKNMRALRISYDEAAELVDDDLAIDRGERLDWEPTVEEEKAMRKATKIVGERKKSTEPVKRERKEDVVKQDLINLIAAALKGGTDVDNVEITNKERMIAFTVGDENFEIMLTKKRKSKK